MNDPLRVKICGITNEADANAAIEAGADALGFNFFAGSRRCVSIEELNPWLPSLAGRTLRVALMVNPTIEEVRRVRPLVDVIQLHGEESPDFCAEAGASDPLWKAFPLHTGISATTVAPFQAEAILIDSAVPGAFGGTGRLIDLDRAASFIQGCAGRQVWLSGGLTPENVAEAVAKTRPYGVDVATGVELAGNPRRKDVNLIRAFIAAARCAAATA
jgi:phosphoribosylanthranilate isomerase